MSRPRSRSPLYRVSPRRQEDTGGHSRRFPWDDPDFDRAFADLGRMPFGGKRHPAEEQKWARHREETHPEGQRKPPLSRDPHRPGHLRHPSPKEFHRRTPPPRPHELGYVERRGISPEQALHRHDGEGARDRGRGGFREDFQGFEVRKRPPHSPQRLLRERLPSALMAHSSHQQRDPSVGWRRDDQGRGLKRSIDGSPRPLLDNLGRGEGRDRGRGETQGPRPLLDNLGRGEGRDRYRGETQGPRPLLDNLGRGEGRDRSRGETQGPRPLLDNLGRGDGRDRNRGETQGPYRERGREDLHRERSPYSERLRREMDDALHPGYRKEDAFSERHRSLETPTDGFGGGPRERRGNQGGFPHREGRASGKLIVEHGHGNIDSRGPPRWKQLDDMRNHGPNRDREVPPRQQGPSQERPRKSNSRSDTREETRGRLGNDVRRDLGHEPKRSPIRKDKTSSLNFLDRGGGGGPLNHRGRISPGPAKGSRNPGRGERMEAGPSRNHPRMQQFPQGHKEPPQARPGFRPREEDWDVDPREEEPHWAKETPELPQWEGERPGIMDRRPPRDGMDPGMPHHRESWNHQQNTDELSVVTEETLTIKVDMNRPTNQNSQLCYSSDRQLSLDLVNVGRQRLDFLPMLGHSGTYRENTTHTGTFAQEIIQLVHQVKEHYFRGDGITLNERFSAPQEGRLEEVEEVVVEERTTLNRRFNMNMDTLPDPEPLFSRLGRMEPLSQDLLRDPEDLRYDLERRRQERLEGVKVTIAGGTLSQRPLGPGSEQNAVYDDDDDDEVIGQEPRGLSKWSEEREQGRRWEGGMGPRRGSPFRQNTGPQQRNNRPPSRPGNRMGTVKRQNNRNNVVGANW